MRITEVSRDLLEINSPTSAHGRANFVVRSSCWVPHATELWISDLVETFAQINPCPNHCS